MRKDLAYYQDKLANLRPDRSSGHPKPHKICLLLAVVDLIDQGVITQNRIYLDKTLQQRFSIHFEKLKQGNDKDDPSQPFFYLESTDFWHHQPHPEHREEYEKRIQDRKHGGPNVVSKLIDYAYLDPELFEILGSQIKRSTILNALYENLSDPVKSFERWALDIGKSPKTVNNYIGALNNSISNWLEEAGQNDKPLFEARTYADFQAIADKARKLQIFEIRDSKGKGMYSAALNLFGSYLSDVTRHEVTEDLTTITKDKTLDETEKSVLMNTRLGQGLFRKQLITYWDGCAVTGYKDVRLLVASHIKPWRSADNRERLDTYNGILLLPNLDKVFDRGFVSFDEKGRLLISKELEQPEKLGLDLDMRVQLRDEHQEYMADHRQETFLA